MEGVFSMTVDFSPIVDPFPVVQSAGADVFTLPEAEEDPIVDGEPIPEGVACEESPYLIVDGMMYVNGVVFALHGSIAETIDVYGGVENLESVAEQMALAMYVNANGEAAAFG